MDGLTEGDKVGNIVGVTEGIMEGKVVTLGADEDAGFILGLPLRVGPELIDGHSDGTLVGCPEGVDDGSVVG